MMMSLIGGLVISQSMSMLIEGSALAITTFYTAKAARKTATTRRK